MKLSLIAFVFASALLFSTETLAQQATDPVQWTLSSDAAKAAPGATVILKLTAKLEPGWHLYSLSPTPGNIPIPTTVSFADSPAVESFALYQPKPEKKLDPSFGYETETFVGEAVLLAKALVKTDAPAGELALTAKVRYQTCNDKTCKPPKTKTAALTLAIDPGVPQGVAFAIPAEYTPAKSSVAAAANPAPSGGAASAEPVAPPAAQSDALGPFLLTAFGVGLLSVFTPCVFPMIPITVSFFLNERGGIMQAVVFSLGIITLFCALGLGVTAAVGPFGVAQLASNPWVNGFIAAVFAAFALSLLGAFEITLPSGLLTKLDQASRRGGYLGTLLMGLTFSLTSFACVGPFVGSLLVSSAQSKGPQTVLGMIAFATGLASPFFFLAAFPSYLKKLPKSGGWLVRVKVVMGFVLLALMLKYLSNIDQVLQSGVVTRERFLAAWFVLFAMPGLYLLGLLRLEGVEAGEALGIGRLLTASAFLIFACTLLPGMFGGRLGTLDAYVPAPAAESSGESAASSGRPAWMKNQYHEALDRARAENKLVLVNFSGYACTNCKWMDANMFPRPEIVDAMKDLVPVELFIDGTDAASEANQKFEEDRFKVVAMPYYALVDPDERLVATFADRATDPREFLAFLKKRPGA
jgi:thiol:disulfide interchange protein